MTFHTRLALLCALSVLLCVVPQVSATEPVTGPTNADPGSPKYGYSQTLRDSWRQFVPAGPDYPCPVAGEEAPPPNPFPTQILVLGITIGAGATSSLLIFIWRRKVKPTFHQEDVQQ
jgi:hypothetical protein